MRRGARGAGARPVLSVADQWYNNHENAHLRTDAGVDSRARGSRIQLLGAAVRCRAEAPPSIPDPSHTPCKEFHSCAFFPGCVPHSQLHSADAWRPGSSASCACAHSSVSTPGVSGRRTTLRGRSTARPDEWQLPRPTGRHCWHHWHSMRTGTTATGSFRSGSAGLPRKWTRWGEGGQANSTALDPAGR